MKWKSRGFGVGNIQIPPMTKGRLIHMLVLIIL
jgi:hypothetical protein